MIRNFSFLVLVLLFSGERAPEKSTDPYKLVSEESKMSLEGSSNLHDWSCNVGSVQGSVSIDENALKEGDDHEDPFLAKASLKIPVEKGIACGKSTMNKKLYEAMKAEEHPMIRYELKTATLEGSADPSGFQLNTVGELRIAGKAREVTIPVMGKRLKEGRYSFAGGYSLNMKDYGVEPPTAMFGSLRTDKEVTIDLLLVFEK